MIPADKEERLRTLLKIFLEENQKLNLSALRTEEACWTGNIVDSLAFLDWKEATGRPVSSIMDIGTGGGFPLLPLAIALPDALCVGLDSTAKKIDAIRRMAQTMDLRNIRLVAERAEVAARDSKHRDKYDVVTSRAVAPLATLLEYTAPFAKQGGIVVLWKSLHVDEELKASEAAQRELYCPLVAKHEYDLSGDWGKRQLLIFEKRAATPKKYPRETGVPKKMPIGS